MEGRRALNRGPHVSPRQGARLRWMAMGVGFLGIVLGCAQVDTYKKRAGEVMEKVQRKASTAPMPCDAEVSDEPPSSCVSGKLWCGATVEGTTLGGHHDWDGEFYNAKFCTPGGDYSGPERVYTLDVPAYTSAVIELQSDCVDLDLFALAFTWSSGACPGMPHSIPNCDSNVASGGGELELQTFQNPGSYLVGVDGKESASGTFRLTVRCEELLRR